MSIFHNTRRAILWELALRQAKKDTGVYVGSHNAMRSLSILNPLARNKEQPYRSEIYRLKSRVIEMFYYLGYCDSLKLKEQRMVCNRCNGKGEIYGDLCHKCWGARYWRIIPLYEFTFSGGNDFNPSFQYIWHQPQSQVDYHVAVDEGDVGVYQATHPIVASAPETEVLYHLARLYLYLIQNGKYACAPVLGLKASWEVDYWISNSSVRRWLDHYRRGLFSLCPDCHRPMLVAFREVGHHDECYPF